jgi:hypothetical protein
VEEPAAQEGEVAAEPDEPAEEEADAADNRLLFWKRVPFRTAYMISPSGGFR